MDITKLIKAGMKEGNIILGYKTVLKTMKTAHPKLVVFANNLPKEKRREVEYIARIANIEIKEYPKDNINLGLVCGKPFPVSILAIKGR